VSVGHVLAGQMILQLEVFLGDLNVTQSHSESLVTEQVHDGGKADAGSEHFCCIGMSQPMGSDASGAARFPCGFHEGPSEDKITPVVAGRLGQQQGGMGCGAAGVPQEKDACVDVAEVFVHGDPAFRVELAQGHM